MNKIIIVGGGAAGLVAGIVAARARSQVTIIEKQNRVGKKILATGNGRCNLTNKVVRPHHYHSTYNKEFFGPVKKVDENNVIAFFEEMGIVPLVEKNKVYPLSEQATSILDVLRLELEKLGVEIIVDTKVTELICKKDKWIVRANDSEGNTKNYKADKVVMATGGLAGVKPDYAMYKMLEKLGHSVTPLFPTLVHITSKEKYCKMLKGIRVQGKATIYENGKKKRSEQGEVLFTEDGLSGPPIFQLSRIAAKSKVNDSSCEVRLDLYPDLSESDILAMIYDRIAKNPERILEDLFVGWINKRVAIAIIKAADIGSTQGICENLDYEMITRLVEVIKGLRFRVEGTREFKFAQATAGGIDLRDINLETMESKVGQGLYITGELMDVDGDCGGYNLQWAWATGFIAGEQAAK